MKLVIGLVVGSILIVGIAVLSLSGDQIDDSSNNFPSSNDLEIGSKAPDFEATTSEGNRVTLENFKGKVLVITSMAAWCPSCIIEAKNIRPVYEEMDKSKVEFLSIDIDPSEGEENLKNFKIDYETPWVYTTREGGQDVINKYGLVGFDYTYVIDKDGKISYIDKGITSSRTMKEEIEKLL